MIRKFTLLSLVSFVVFALLLPASCKKFQGSQTVPAYIRIDSVGLSCDYYTYGANTHAFIDVWAYVDGDDVGSFELPTTIPILKEGRHTVSFLPGIARDGISSYYRPYYPFIALLDVELNLVPDSIIHLFPVFNYWPNGNNLHVRWMEDFEGGSIKLQSTAQSDADICSVGLPYAWTDNVHSFKSGKVTLTSDSLQFCVATTEEFTDLPTTGSSCMMEMDYKCSDTCAVGLFYLDGSVQQFQILRLRPTGASGEEPEQWKKIYINLGPYLVDFKDAEYFKIYLSSWYNRNDGPQYFYYDNLKIIYRDRP